MKTIKSIITKATNGYIITVGDETSIIEGDAIELSRQYNEKVFEEIDRVLKCFVKCEIAISISGLTDAEWYTTEDIPRAKTALVCRNKGVEDMEILYYDSGRFYLKHDCKGEYKLQKPEFWKYAPLP